MKQITRHLHSFLILFGILVSINAKADTWELPSVKVYYSENKEYKLVITPIIIPDKYYPWDYYKSNRHPQTKKILRKKEKFMQNISGQDTILIPCTAELYRIIEPDSVLIWKRTLLNYYSPVHAIISNDGSSIATFDNWFSTGYGGNVFVVYNEKGDAKKTYKLEEISPFPLNNYSMSISSIYWRSMVRFVDNERIEVIFESEDKKQIKRIYNTRILEFE